MSKIDLLPAQQSHIDLAQHQQNTFNSVLVGYNISGVFDDIMLVEFIDDNEAGEIKRGSIFVKIDSSTNAWRIGKVILAGPNVKYTKVNDLVMFPNNLGIKVTNLDVEGYGNVKRALFINEARLFGLIKERKETSASIPRISKKSVTK
jgi:cellobiose-specific phosphotransferase system component IIB